MNLILLFANIILASSFANFKPEKNPIISTMSLSYWVRLSYIGKSLLMH
jgi:hypothetical protein